MPVSCKTPMLCARERRRGRMARTASSEVRRMAADGRAAPRHTGETTGGVSSSGSRAPSSGGGGVSHSALTATPPIPKAWLWARIRAEARVPSSDPTRLRDDITSSNLSRSLPPRFFENNISRTYFHRLKSSVCGGVRLAFRKNTPSFFHARNTGKK